jgi:PTS system ascorbate-specific IIA component
MVGIVIVAHTPVASAMLGFAEHTYGASPERVRAVDIPPYEDTKASFDRVMKAAYAVNTGNGVLILTDVMGATPANVASKLEALGPLSGLSAPVVVLAGLNKDNEPTKPLSFANDTPKAFKDWKAVLCAKSLD